MGGFGLNVSVAVKKTILEQFQKFIAPDPDITVSEWADRHRVLTSETSSEVGPWETSRTPYLREIMNCLSSLSPWERVVFMKGAQIGGTEAGLNWLGYIITHAPGPVLMVQPTKGIAEDYSQQRISPMIRASSVLSDLVNDPRSRDSGNRIKSKRFPGGILMIVGANSAADLSSKPIRFLFLDETDRYPWAIGVEGDPIGLALQRTANFLNRKIFFVSTPTIKNFSRIETAYEESDRRRYWVPCPHCKQEQVLEWKQVRWPSGKPKEATYYCAKCEKSIQHFQKAGMLAGGRWIAANPGHDVAGFHLSSIYSPWTTWAELAVEFVACGKDQSKLQIFINTKLGETWEESAEQVDGEGLIVRRENFGKTLPDGIAILTAGVDVQDDRLEAEIVGWGRQFESWSVGYWILEGDPSAPSVWADLDRLLKKPFRHANGLDLSVRAAAIDTQGHHTAAVYDFCRMKQQRKVWPINGQGTAGIPIWPRRPSKNNIGKVPHYNIGVNAAKEVVYTRLRIEEPGPGYCHFPLDRSIEWFKQLTAEKITTTYFKGRKIRQWINPAHARNEAFDCRVYALAALYGLISVGVDLDVEADRMAAVLECGADKNQREEEDRQVMPSSWMKS